MDKRLECLKDRLDNLCWWQEVAGKINAPTGATATAQSPASGTSTPANTETAPKVCIK